MWRDLGVRRTGSGMNEALKKMRFWSRAVQAMPLEDPRAWEFSNMLQVAQLITLSALAREESRGVHHRSDFEGAQPEWLAHTELTPMGDETRIEGVGIERRVLERSLSTS
jgi:L-aspartate oxidase